jgi:hypothetical protein
VTSILHEDLCRYIRYAALHCQTWPTIWRGAVIDTSFSSLF